HARFLPNAHSSRKQKTLASRRGSLWVFGGSALLALDPPCPSVLPPAVADEKPDEALNDDENRAEKGERGRLVGVARHVHAATLGRHDDRQRAAIQALKRSHGPRSLSAWPLQTQPDDPPAGLVQAR